MFADVVKQHDSNIKNRDVREALKGSDSYTLHKSKRKPRVYRRTYAKGIGEAYQLDLCDMKKHEKENDGYSYILTIIDIFSKKDGALDFLIEETTVKNQNVSHIATLKQTYIMREG